MLNMPRFESKYEMAIEITGVERCRRIVIEHYQVIRAMSFEIVALKVLISIAETVVNAVVANAIEILTNKKGSFGASQHIAVHAVGAHHYVFAKSFRIEKTNFVIQIAFGILNHPDRAITYYILFIFAQMQAMTQNGFS